MNKEIQPRNKWKELSINELYETKERMTTLYFNMIDINATFANQYSTFLKEIQDIIDRKETAH